MTTTFEAADNYPIANLYIGRHRENHSDWSFHDVLVAEGAHKDAWRWAYFTDFHDRVEIKTYADSDYDSEYTAGSAVCRDCGALVSWKYNDITYLNTHRAWHDKVEGPHA